MQLHIADLFGIAVALASLYAAYAETMIPLRIAAIAANALAIVYCLLLAAYPLLALNVILLALNAWRLAARGLCLRECREGEKGGHDCMDDAHGIASPLTSAGEPACPARTMAH